MKIPKRVNNALDWAEDNIRVIMIVTALVIVSATAMWMPAIAAFVAGALVGGVAVRWRMARRLARLRADADDLLRENGALRHQNTLLSQGVIASSGQLTQRLPVIRPVEERPPAPRIEAPAPEARPSESPASGTLELDGPDEATDQDADAPRTERLPIIPWDDEPTQDNDQDTPLMGVIRPRR
ncbi:hypothetical protein ACRYCC_04000 [Actinomadura scrupuli]|uniref:hypothetical protein n=1 Tax=Actinomadura scrupuli TaxID=559629 RepID=UPI003D985DFC